MNTKSGRIGVQTPWSLSSFAPRGVVLRAVLIIITSLHLIVSAQRPSTAVMQQAPPVDVLDVLRVRAEGDSSQAILHIPAGPEHVHDCDIVIIGADLGGVSAALEAAREGTFVCMTDPTVWVGGQMTSEGVPAIDGNRWIDSTGATASFANLSYRIRAAYSTRRQRVRETQSKASLTEFNPGNCWVSSLCFQPEIGLAVLRSLLKPYIAQGRIHLWLHTVPVRVSRKERTIQSVLAYDLGRRQWLRLRGKYFVDDSALGDLIALCGLPYRSGAEARSETGEPDAPERANPLAVQSFTYPFLMLRNKKSVPGTDNKPPEGYEKFEASYSLEISNSKGTKVTYKVFEEAPGTPGSFWDYRRLVDASQFKPGAFPADISSINWNSNDYCDARLVSGDPLQEANALQQGKRLSLGFAWWLRHNVPRDDDSARGYAELQLLAPAFGSDDGLSQQPYIRESRRIIPLRTIVEQNIAVEFQQGARGETFPDTVGIGQYPIDIHTCTGTDFASQTKPYQVPLGALIDRDVDNLLAASTDIGTTHITNGAYRLHPTLWSIGEAVGATITWAIKHKTTPAAIDRSREDLTGLQRTLTFQGHPIFWFDDVPPDSSLFAAAQMVAVLGWLPVDSATLHFGAQNALTGPEVLHALTASGLSAHMKDSVLRRISAAPSWSNLPGIPPAGTKPDDAIRRGSFARWILDAVFHGSGSRRNQTSPSPE